MNRIAAAFLGLLLAAIAHAGPLGPDGAPGTTLPGKFTWFDLATR